MSALDLMPLFNRALEALRSGRDIATTMQVLGMYDASDRIAIVGADVEARQRQAFAVGQGLGHNTVARAVLLVTLAELPRTAQLALAGQYAEVTRALVVASMERDRRPRCVAQPYTLAGKRRIVDDRLGGHIMITPPPEVVALLGRFWDGVEESEKVAAMKPRTVGRRR